MRVHVKASDYALIMSEDELQASVEELLERYHYLWFHDEDSRKNESGLPDVIAVHPRTGFLIIAELKKQGGRFRGKQLPWLNALRLRARPHTYIGVWRPQQWVDGTILTTIRAGAGILGRAQHD